MHVNMLVESGVIGHLMGSYDGGGPGHQWGLERCEIVGHDARIVITDACEALEFQPRGKIESEMYKYLGNMRSFGDTFEMVTPVKMARIRRATELWLLLHPELAELDVRFDVIAERAGKIEHLPAAF